MAAAGRLQTGENDSEARRFIRLAQNWGASRKLINQILIAGVHNNLGRAAVINSQQQRAFQHFEDAIAIGTPGSDTKLLTRARSSEQFGQLRLPSPGNCARTEMGETTAAVPGFPSFTKNLETIINTLGQQKVEFDAQFKKQADELVRVRKFLDSTLKKEVANATKQIKSFIGLQSYLATGELPSINIEQHSWPVSPDFALYLIELIEFNDYDLIIEFGSGLSTVIIAKAIRRAARRQGKKPADFVSFDHLEHYYKQTCTQLEHAGLINAVQLILAPLQDWQDSNGRIQPYYACQSTLTALKQKYVVADLRILVIVDGPPAATGKHARYPAGPLILEHFANAHIDLLLDDYIREDEKEIVQRWQTDIAAAGFSQIATEYKLEKDACLIKVQSINQVSHLKPLMLNH
ncbi:MAG: class I SAM-dependent methyltransferase [Nitrosomonas sp.]|uniref:hypothetical protein n=1 Tax=Nitrosomonas sp. TaxID=42353 RepID=UPI002B3EF276|nr:hypothetical protein [Nitrosomonas sp.]MEB2332286.1 class I SAM-dependent methyltransferase [Nitrosomonas sp.]